MSETPLPQVTCSACGKCVTTQLTATGTPKQPAWWRRTDEGLLCKKCAKEIAPQPAYIYAYDCKLANNADLIRQQMRLGHQYRNERVTMEQRRRERSAAVLTATFPQLAALEADVERLKALKEEQAAAIKLANAVARRKRATPAERAQLSETKAQLSQVWEQLREIKRQMYAHPTVSDDLAAIDHDHKEAGKVARKLEGLFWGTSGLIDNSCKQLHKGAPPARKGWRGEGQIGVQIQHGISVERAMSGRDTRLRIDPVDESAWTEHRTRGQRARALRTTVHIRVNSDDRKRPIWASVTLTLHRPLPPQGLIKWVYLNCRNFGAVRCERPGSRDRHERWKICFVVEGQRPRRHSLSPDGRVGLDVGYRLRPDGLRVAMTYDGTRCQELLLPQYMLDSLAKYEHLQSTIDTHYNEVHPALVAWLAGRTVPEWLTERTETLSQWKSSGRLAALVTYWWDNRFAGDEEIMQRLLAWRSRYRHLEDYRDGRYKRIRRRRTDLYRNFARDLASQYRTVMLEDLDLRKLAKKPEGDSPRSNDARFAENQRILACLSELLKCLRESGIEIIPCDPMYTTMMCHECRSVEVWDQTELMHTCSQCGATWDQDENAAKNLWAFGQVPQEA